MKTNDAVLAFNPGDIACWCGGEWHNGKPGGIEGICTDSRSIGRNSLFLALRGERFDGHDFVGQAFEKGASCAVVDKEFVPPPDFSLPFLSVKDTRTALLGMAKGYRDKLGLRVIAVTGSVGKTSTKEMIADVVSSAYPTARTRGNWNNDIGVPLSILSIKPGVRFGVLEAGMNHPGELRPLCELLSPEIGVVTRIGPVHLEHFDSIEDIALEKASLVRSLPSDGVAVLNIDDEYAHIFEKAAPCRIVRISMLGGADFSAVVEPDGGALFFEAGSDEAHRIKLKVPGEHNISNALSAVVVGRILNIEWPAITAALESFRLPPMRWEESKAGGVNIINDAYNASPQSMRAALKTFAGMDSAGGKWLVLSEMRELGAIAESEHVKLGEYIAAGRWSGLITIGDMGGLIGRGARDFGMDGNKVFQCRDIEDAAGLLKKKTSRGDTVLIKASRGVGLERILGFL